MLTTFSPRMCRCVHTHANTLLSLSLSFPPPPPNQQVPSILFVAFPAADFYNLIGSWWVLIVGLVLLLCTVVAFLSAALADPGIIPRNVENVDLDAAEYGYKGKGGCGWELWCLIDWRYEFITYSNVLLVWLLFVFVVCLCILVCFNLFFHSSFVCDVPSSLLLLAIRSLAIERAKRTNTRSHSHTYILTNILDRALQLQTQARAVSRRGHQWAINQLEILWYVQHISTTTLFSLFASFFFSFLFFFFFLHFNFFCSCCFLLLLLLLKFSNIRITRDCRHAGGNYIHSTIGSAECPSSWICSQTPSVHACHWSMNFKKVFDCSCISEQQVQFVTIVWSTLIIIARGWARVSANATIGPLSRF